MTAASSPSILCDSLLAISTRRALYLPNSAEKLGATVSNASNPRGFALRCRVERDRSFARNSSSTSRHRPPLHRCGVTAAIKIQCMPAIWRASKYAAGAESDQLLRIPGAGARSWRWGRTRDGPRATRLARVRTPHSIIGGYLNTSRLFKRGTMMGRSTIGGPATFKTRDFLDLPPHTHLQSRDSGSARAIQGRRSSGTRGGRSQRLSCHFGRSSGPDGSRPASTRRTGAGKACA